MLKEDYAAHYREMSARIRAEEGAGLDDNIHDFYQNGNLWALSWLGHLASVEAALYDYSNDQKHLQAVKKILKLFASVRREMIRRFYEGSLAFCQREEKQEAVKGPLSNPLDLQPEGRTDPELFPIIETLFSYTPFMRALKIIGREAFSDEEWQEAEALSFAHVEYLFRDYEWGCHNRAALRGISMLLFGLLFPEHARAEDCIRAADNFFELSLGEWSIEDATSYLGIWCNCIAEYTQYRGIWNFRIEGILSYYAHYFLAMLLPSGGLPEFGDSRFDSGTSSCLALGFTELMAKKLRSPVLKYSAERQFKNMTEHLTMDNGVQYERGLTNAFLWGDDSITAEEPNLLSCEVLEDLVGKKVVFRDSWEEDACYLFYNYRDVGDYGKLTRDYLQQTIPVLAEKPHHGHADEQSVAALCAGGAVFLRDGGYRDHFTTDGHYRADFYHNRLVLREGRMFREKGFLEFAENIGDYLPQRSEKLYFNRFSFAEVFKSRLYDEARRAECDRLILFLKEEKIFLIVDTVRALCQEPLSGAVLFHGERIDALKDGRFRIYEETQEGLRHFNRYKFKPEKKARQSLLLCFAGVYDGISQETLRRNYRQEETVSCLFSRYFQENEYLSVVSLLIPECGKTRNETEAARRRAEQIADSLVCSQDRGGKHLSLRFKAGGKNWQMGMLCDEKARIEDLNLRPAYSFEAGRADYGPFSTDALFLISNGERFAFTDGSRVDYKGSTLFSSYPNSVYQTDFVRFLRRAGSRGSYEAPIIPS